MASQGAAPGAAEQRLVWLMKVWVLLFFTGGVLFLARPRQLICNLNQAGEWFGLEPLAVGSGPSEVDFWVVLAAAMMFTIAFLAAVVARAPKHSLPCSCAIVLAKAASSGAGLAMYIFKAKALAYIVIFVVDFPIGLLTALVTLAAYRAYLPRSETALGSSV